jgi:hypothetical protein
MHIEKKDHTTVFSWEKGDPRGMDFKNLIKAHYKHVLSQNIVVDLSLRYPLYPNQLLEFSELSHFHKSEANKSFVLVAGNLSIDDLPDEISVTPTLEEALDLIDMEEIERDLGYE